jgi:hypothetical protein
MDGTDTDYTPNANGFAKSGIIPLSGDARRQWQVHDSLPMPGLSTEWRTRINRMVDAGAPAAVVTLQVGS